MDRVASSRDSLPGSKVNDGQAAATSENDMGCATVPLRPKGVMWPSARSSLVPARAPGCRNPACTRQSAASDWAVKHSTTGFTFQYANASISWGSKKQTSVALSSCEAETMAASEAAKEAVYLREFLRELGFGGKKPTKLYCDNQGAVDLAYNPEHHQKTKHIDRRHFYVRELVERCQLEVPYVKTAENLGDFFTKPLAVETFRTLRDKIMNMQQLDPDDKSRTQSRKGRDECRDESRKGL